MRIYCTSNSKDWKETLYLPEKKVPGRPGPFPGDSVVTYGLHALKFVSATEAWACGAQYGKRPAPLFLHTTDSGAHWEAVEGSADLDGSSCWALDMISEEVGYAAIANGYQRTARAGVAKFSTDAPAPAPTNPPPTPPTPRLHHYGNPNAGPCSPDEVLLQVPNGTGTFCSPRCCAMSGRQLPCPVDVPGGAHVTPYCSVLNPAEPRQCGGIIGQFRATNCVLLCNFPEASCPAGASCKMFSATPPQGRGAMCVYDT